MRSPQLLIRIIIVISLMLLLFGLTTYRQQLIPERPMLDVVFDHALHKEEPCASCHHNYVDGAEGSGGCYDCHKYSKKISLDMEATFHDFCRNCHIKKSQEQEKYGPVRQCGLCHLEDQIID